VSLKAVSRRIKLPPWKSNASAGKSAARNNRNKPVRVGGFYGDKGETRTPDHGLMRLLLSYQAVLSRVERCDHVLTRWPGYTPETPNLWQPHG
jgi:hypothetical protein